MKFRLKPRPEPPGLSINGANWWMDPEPCTVHSSPKDPNVHSFKQKVTQWSKRLQGVFFKRLPRPATLSDRPTCVVCGLYRSTASLESTRRYVSRCRDCYWHRREKPSRGVSFCRSARRDGTLNCR